MSDSEPRFTKIKIEDDFKKVIVVECIQFVAAILIKLLKEENYFVFHSSTAKSAKFLTANYSPDIILVSERLPDQLGFELIRDLRTINPDVIIIYISSKDSEKLEKDSISAGASYYLLKPFEKRQLTDIINSLMGEKNGN